MNMTFLYFIDQPPKRLGEKSIFCFKVILTKNPEKNRNFHFEAPKVFLLSIFGGLSIKYKNEKIRDFFNLFFPIFNFLSITEQA
jgi:hypothetical protein